MKESTILFGFLLVYSTMCSQDLEDGLIAHYPFEGNSNDVTLSGNNGTLQGPTYVNDRWGNPNAALHLNGSSDFVSIAAASNFKPTEFPLTVTAWIRFLGDTGEGGGIFLNNIHADYYFGVFFNINSATQTIQISYGDGGIISPETRRTKTGITSLADSEWHLVAGIIRGPTDMDLYVDCRNDEGNYSGTGGNLAYNNGNGDIGRVDQMAYTGPDYYQFNGDIDEVRFYDRELSPSEICELYNLPAPITGVVQIPEVALSIAHQSNSIITFAVSHSLEVLEFKVYDFSGKLVKPCADVISGNESSFRLSSTGFYGYSMLAKDSNGLKSHSGKFLMN